MKLQKGTKLFTPSGEEIGHIDRVVIDPRSKQVSHVIVQKGLLFPTDKVVPINFIQMSADGTASLRTPIDDPDYLPDFEETAYITMDAYEAGEEFGTPEEEAEIEPLYWYPPVGAQVMRYGASATSTHSFMYPDPMYVKKTVRNIPEDAVPLKEGADVYSSDGEHVGDVYEVLTESVTQRATHIVISKGLLFTEHKLVPTSWIAEVKEDEIRLSVDSDLMDRLRAFEPVTA